mgnify:CR=1 FL=1
MYANIKTSNIRKELEEKMTVVGYCRLSRDEDKENNGGDVGDGNGNGKPDVTTECKSRSD